MNLKAFLVKHKIWHQFIKKKETVHTADAAAVAGVELKRLTKSLVFFAKYGKPILAIIPGDCKANKKKIASVLKLKRVTLAPFEEAEKYSGYPPGATSPVGHKQQMEVIIDEKLLQHDTIYGGGGKRTTLVELKPEDVVKLNKARVANISEKISGD